MIPWLTPSMIESRASGTLTRLSTCMRDAPKAVAASTAVGDTPRTPFATRRMTTGSA